MLSKTSAQLVAHLSDANGWWRDTAQQLLVLKQDKSVVHHAAEARALATAIGGAYPTLWTSRPRRGRCRARAPADGGQGRADRIQAVRVSETLYKAGDKTLAADYKLNTDADVDVVMQSLMTMNTLKVADAPAALKQAQAANKAKVCSWWRDDPEPQRRWRTRRRNLHGGRRTVHHEEQAVLDKGREIYTAGVLRLPRRGRQRRTRPGIESAPPIGPLAGSSPRGRAVGRREGPAARRHRPARRHHILRR